MPGAGHSHVGVQHEAVVPGELQVFAVTVHGLDHAAWLGQRPDQPTGLDVDQWLADERDAQGGGSSVDRVTLRHDT